MQLILIVSGRIISAEVLSDMRPEELMSLKCVSNEGEYSSLNASETSLIRCLKVCVWNLNMTSAIIRSDF